jgi:hypothetical protein
VRADRQIAADRQGAEESKTTMKFRKKPVVIDAMQFLGPQVDHVGYMQIFDDWIVANQGERICRYVGDTMVIPTLEGDHVANVGDWIIRGIKGELYPCKPDIFERTYEPVIAAQKRAK